MKRKILALLIVGVVFQSRIMGQIPIAVIQDSVSTQFHYIDSASKSLELLNNSLQEIKFLAETVKNQAKMIESLARGDWEGMVLALDYATRSLDSFLEGTAYLENFENLDLSSRNFKQLRDQSKILRDSVAAASNAMWQTNDLVQMTKTRVAQAQRLGEISRKTDSVTGQLQIVGQHLSLVQGELVDTNKLLVARSNYLAARHLQEEADIVRHDHFIDNFNTVNNWYEPRYSREDYIDVVRGKKFMDAWNRAK